MDDRLDEARIDDDRIAALWWSLHDEMRRRGASPQIAEDIAQETWLAALNTHPAKRDRFGGWLHLVCSRLLSRTRAQEALRARREHDLARLNAGQDGSTRNENGESADLIRFVAELPDPYRTVLRMRFFEERELAEIAAIQGVPKATVQTRLKRGIARLRTRLEPRRNDRRWSLLAWFRELWSRSKSPQSALRLSVALIGAASVLATFLVALERPGDAKLAARSASPAERDEPRVALAHGRATLASRSPDGSTASVEPQRARVAGRVLSPRGEPVAGALVQLAPPGSGIPFRATSDERGQYAIDAAGEFLWASHPDWCESARCYVPSVLDRDRLDLMLVATRGRASVRVVDHVGRPVAGARVIADDGSPGVQIGTTRGTLEVAAPPLEAMTGANGVAELVLRDAPFVDLTVLAPSGQSWSRRVRTPASGEVLNIELPRGGRLTGVCVDAAGHPLWKARVEVEQLEGCIRRTATTDAEGRFEIDRLASGEFVARARPAEPGRLSARHEGTLEPGGSLSLRLELDERASLFGRVLCGDEPIAGARVVLENARPVPAESDRREEITDVNGRFSFPGCRVRSGHRVRVFRPGDSEACHSLAPLRPNRGEVWCIVEPGREEPAPISLAFSGATSNVPRLVELRSQESTVSAVLAVQPGAAQVRSDPLPAGAYRVLGWQPDLGAWWLDWIEHEPRRTAAHVIPLPDRGELRVALELPPRTPCEALEVALLTPSLALDGRIATSERSAWRRLAWSEREGVFVASVPAGVHTLALRGAGFAEVTRTVRVAPGASERVTCALLPGIECTLFFRSVLPTEPGRIDGRGMFPNEILCLESWTPWGSATLDLVGLDQRLVDDGFEFTVWIPSATEELRANTKPDPRMRSGFMSREGSRRVEPGTLDVSDGRVRLAIDLRWALAPAPGK